MNHFRRIKPILILLCAIAFAAQAHAVCIDWDGEGDCDEDDGALPNTSLAPTSGPVSGGLSCGDPVDLYSGLYVQSTTDLVVRDLIPIVISRTYRPKDPTVRAFGVGTSLSYNMYLVNHPTDPNALDLVSADGSRVTYSRTVAGNKPSEAIYTALATPTRYLQSTVRAEGDHWLLQFKDGVHLRFAAGSSPGNLLNTALIGITDRAGNTLTLTRDAKMNLTNIASPHGHNVVLSYDAANRVTQVTDNIGRTVVYAYDGSGHLVRVTDPLGKVESFVYDASGNLQRPSDRRGKVHVTNTYDAAGLVLRQTYSDGSTTSFAYTSFANGKTARTEVTDERGVVTRFTFSDFNGGYPVSVTRALGQPEQQTVSYVRDPLSNLITSATDALGRKTAYSYDSHGNVLSITRLDGTANAITTVLSYTSDFNQVASVTDASGKVTRFGYDSKGNLTSVHDANGNLTQFGYNAQGKLVSLTNALGKTRGFSYDVGDLVKMTDELGHITNFYADPVGRLAQITDALGNRTQADIDALDRVTQLVDAVGQATSGEYDGNGNLTRVVDPKGNAHSYAYDLRDYPKTYTDPLGKNETYAYDAAHNLIMFTDRKGQATQYRYDRLNRLVGITYAGGGSIAATYDAGNRLTKLVDSANGTIAYTYDLLDRPTSVTTAKGSVAYTYYANGLRQSMTVSGQPTLNYSYDPGGRLIRIVQAAGPSNNNIARTILYSYDAANRRTRTTLANGQSINYAYDDASRLVSITYKQANGTTIGDLRYTYDAAGRIVATDGTLARTTVPASATASITAGNRLSAHNGSALTYDANGNLLADGTNTYTWNTRNQLVQISGATTASFTYDATGRRQTKVVNGVAAGYVYDGLNVVQELNAANVDNSAAANIRANYLTGLGIDETLAMLTGTGSTATLSSYLTDGLGSTLRLTDGAGNKLIDYTYGPYGETRADGASLNPFQYTGRENDGTGLYYYRARYYAPVLTRFISEDPIGLDGGANFYTYVGGNPISSTDPLGLYWFRQPWQQPDYVVGRPGTIVSPGGPVGSFIENYVPAGRTFGEMHDNFVDAATAAGIPDWIANIPSMTLIYREAVIVEVMRTIGILPQPVPPNQCKK